MINQDILYSECPCGSGKKFKFCCYPAVRGDLPKDPSRAEVTEAIRRHSRTMRAMEHPDEILVVDIDRFHGLIDKGLRLLRDGRYGEAKKAFLTAKKEGGMFPTAYNNLALCELAQGNLSAAEEWTQEVIRRFPAENPFGMALQADIFYMKGEMVRALDVIERAEAIEPPSVDQAARLCESMAHFKDHERILRYADKSGYADDPEVAWFRGIALANLGKCEEAVKAMRIASRGMLGEQAKRILADLVAGRRPSTICGDWMYILPETFTLFAGIEQARRTKDAQLDDFSEELIAEFIEVEANAGMIAIPEVVKILSSLMCSRSERMLDAIRTDASRPEAVRKSADEAYRKLFVDGGRDEIPWNENAVAMQKMVITEEAETHAAIEPAYEESYFKAVRICLDQESKKSDLEVALRLLEDLYAKVPDNPAVANNYASVLSRLGHIAKAVGVLQKCFAQYPEYVFGAANYLNTLILTNKMDEAAAMIRNYRLPLRIHPDAYAAWCRMSARYYAMVGDEKQLRNAQEGLEMIRKNFGK